MTRPHHRRNGLIECRKSYFINKILPVLVNDKRQWVTDPPCKLSISECPRGRTAFLSACWSRQYSPNRFLSSAWRHRRTRREQGGDRVGVAPVRMTRPCAQKRFGFPSI